MITDRALSFDAWAGDYDRFRPGYPDELFDEIGRRLELSQNPQVVDLGAGTGRAALAMAERGWRVTAVEPGHAMLDVLRARASDAGLLVATRQASAEATGLSPGSVDLVTAAQSFHWFDKERAVAEIARVVRPGGGVALFWNVRDEKASPFVAAYHALLEERFGDADTGRYLQAGRPSGQDATRQAFEGLASFAPLEKVELRHELMMSAEEFLGMAFTASYVRALPDDEQVRFRADVASLLTTQGLAGLKEFIVPYRVDLWITRRSEA
ncbi:MAG TPA: class I SAM-dependent methyltransferase [Candidatus Saccharimonadales bacterium]|nr:class I SAM-dependent methyltransferase [Candidatus Saccharimonadales bacterium]